jgi:hypothetical protein
MVRTAAYIPHETKMYSLSKESSINLLGAIIAASGGGKTRIDGIAENIVDTPLGMMSPVPMGSGEGIAERFMEGKGKKREQSRHNVYMYGDEGRIMHALQSRKGSTLDETLCVVFTGLPFGQSNASAETSRLVSNYAFGFLVNLVFSALGKLIELSEGGLPQRVLYAYAQHPGIPDPDTLTEDDSVHAPHINVTNVGKRIDFDSKIRREIRRAIWLQSRPKETLTEEELKELEKLPTDPLDKHRPWLRAKCAAIFCIWDGRTLVNDEDIGLEMRPSGRQKNTL